jgi:two-component system, cell cycle response regulator DivK
MSVLAKPLERRQKTILIVEDNPLNMKLFNDVLEGSGYRTILTNDGRAAMALAESDRPDLILMDIELPEVNGLEVTKWIKDRESLRDIPIIAVTALAMRGDEERIRRGGCEGYISKPITVKRFLEAVSHHLG